MKNLDEFKYIEVTLDDVVDDPKDVFFVYSESNICEIEGVSAWTVFNNPHKLVRRVPRDWKEVAQEFCKNHPILSKDKFFEDVFTSEWPEYNEPLKELILHVYPYIENEENCNDKTQSPN